MVDIVLQLNASLGDSSPTLPLLAEMTMQGGVMSFRVGLGDKAPPITLTEIWDHITGLFEQVGIDLPSLPSGSLWDPITHIGVIPTFWITPSGQNDKVAGYLELELREPDGNPPHIGGTASYGPVDVTLEPDITLEAIIISYMPGQGLSLKTKISTGTSTGGSPSPGSPSATKSQLVGFPPSLPAQNSGSGSARRSAPHRRTKPIRWR
jgi:hypothetical protein